MCYKIKKDELLKLLIRAYTEGNCGFLDLAETVALRIIDEIKKEDERTSSYTPGNFTFTETNLIPDNYNPIDRQLHWEPYLETDLIIGKETTNG